MKKSELNQALREELERRREALRYHISAGEKGAAWCVANQIAGVVNFAERLDLLTWDQARDIREEACNAALYGFRVEAEDEPA